MTRLIPFLRELLVGLITSVIPAEPAFVRKFLTDFVEALLPILAVATFVVPGSIDDAKALAFTVAAAVGAALMPAFRRAYPEFRAYVLSIIEARLYPTNNIDWVSLEDDLIEAQDSHTATDQL